MNASEELAIEELVFGDQMHWSYELALVSLESVTTAVSWFGRESLPLRGQIIVGSSVDVVLELREWSSVVQSR